MSYPDTQPWDVVRIAGGSQYEEAFSSQPPYRLAQTHAKELFWLQNSLCGQNQGYGCAFIVVWSLSVPDLAFFPLLLLFPHVLTPKTLKKYLDTVTAHLESASIGLMVSIEKFFSVISPKFVTCLLSFHKSQKNLSFLSSSICSIS